MNNDISVFDINSIEKKDYEIARAIFPYSKISHAFFFSIERARPHSQKGEKEHCTELYIQIHATRSTVCLVEQRT